MHTPIIGVDEVGRGSWAGPLVAAAVCVPADWQPDGVADSKQLSRQNREQYLGYIQETATAIGIGWVSPPAIDTTGLQAATTRAMSIAVSQIVRAREQVVIDGRINYLPEIPNTRCQVKADQTVPAVAAASIVAKVFRDGYMRRIHQLHPDYGFNDHVGYGTRQHRAALEATGACGLHRFSFAPVKVISSK